MNTSTKYTIQLNNIKDLPSGLAYAGGPLVSELDIALQVWQDLNRLSIVGKEKGQMLAMEDQLIKKILEQILIAEHGTIPEGYEPVQKQVTEEEARAMGIQLPPRETLTAEEVNEKYAEENPVYIPPATVGEREERHL